MTQCKPDDQVIDYFIYRNKVDKAMIDIKRFITGYQFWYSKFK